MKKRQVAQAFTLADKLYRNVSCLNSIISVKIFIELPLPPSFYCYNQVRYIVIVLELIRGSNIYVILSSRYFPCDLKLEARILLFCYEFPSVLSV